MKNGRESELARLDRGKNLSFFKQLVLDLTLDNIDRRRRRLLTLYRDYVKVSKRRNSRFFFDFLWG